MCCATEYNASERFLKHELTQWASFPLIRSAVVCSPRHRKRYSFLFVFNQSVVGFHSAHEWLSDEPLTEVWDREDDLRDRACSSSTKMSSHIHCFPKRSQKVWQRPKRSSRKERKSSQNCPGTSTTHSKCSVFRPLVRSRQDAAAMIIFPSSLWVVLLLASLVTDGTSEKRDPIASGESFVS